MIISHNLAATSAHRRMQENARNNSSHLQKLSSGQRIDSASDDAAGLAISEKMRAQIRGLDQANRNIQDGISLVQTAEGGLQEISAILQRQRELIVQGLNDTYTNNDRLMIESEIQELTNEINHISQNTSYNTINLLARDDYEILADRSSSSTNTSLSEPPTIPTVQKTVVYAASGTPPEARHLTSISNTSSTTQTYTNTNVITPITSQDLRQGYNEYNVDTYTTTKTDTERSVYETLALTTDPQYSAPDYWYASGMNTTWFGPKTLGRVYGTMSENVEVDGMMRPVEYTSRSNTGTVPAWDHMWFPNTDVSIKRLRTILPDNSMQIEYIINNGNPTDTNLKLSNLINPPDNSVMTDANGLLIPNGVTSINSPSGNTYTMTGTEANANITFDNSLGSLSPTQLAIHNPAGGQPTINFDWDVNLPSQSSLTFAFKYGPFSLNLDVFERTNETEVSTRIETTSNVEIKDIDYITPKLTVQAGANQGQHMDIPLFNVQADELGITTMGLLPPSIQEQALSRVDKAISKISSIRGIYGAIQNRMEHALNNTSNATENLSNAESRIRDADMAKEMLEYTKSNILLQAAQAMLTQSNQSPQSVLQLLHQ
ncbi:flagellar protein [Paenibacillus amylolyticus]|uniref:Flagellin n=1 Tax=Paenibacillus amylolyticus TaxID=1451 RepID=A0A5M9WTZ3_PAEAM|nr:flagellin [Paenibacillus amylolyticus]KAA8785114.1 flagellar protein [Paenibacillus amylolyticus]